MAFSDGPVTISDLFKIQGERMSLSTRSVTVKQDVDQNSVIPPSMNNQVPKFSVSNVLNDQRVTINSIIIICYYK